MSIPPPSTPPQPPQQPYMGGGYVPPSVTTQRRGPGCWVYGLLSCLVVVVILAILIGTGFYRFFHTKEGRQLLGSVNSVMRGTQNLVACEKKMRTVRDAVVRYHARTGHYPPSLAALTGSDLADKSMLHCDIDPSKDPAHITFAYTKPADNAPSTTPLLSFHWKNTIVMGEQQEEIDTEVTMLINGQVTNNQTQKIISTSGPGGATTTTKTVHQNGASGVSTSTTTSTSKAKTASTGG